MNGLEVAGFALAIAMVVCNIREIHWGWPLAIASSALYFFVFWDSRIYGDASLQVVFAVVAGWGWFQWLRGRRGDGSALNPVRLSRNALALAAGAWAVLWPAIGFLLARFTDSDVAWWDAFCTAGSLVGQFLLGRKYIENWAVWIVVNAVYIGLYLHKELWLTAGLYALFIAMSIAGWRAWQTRLTTRPA